MQTQTTVSETTLLRQIGAARESTAFAALPGRAFLRVSGPDATRWLNGMVTNSVLALVPGTGAYNFVLNAQGRIQGDATIYCEPSSTGAHSYLLSTTGSQAERLQPWLERYIIMDDVELTPALVDEASLLVLGPQAPASLQHVGLPTPDPLQLARADSPVGPVLLFTPAPGSIPGSVPRVELHAPTAVIEALRSLLLAAGVAELSPGALEVLRLQEGTPLFGTDIGERDLPQETGQTQALHFSKGCYLGQEIVERIRSRGQVHRFFTRFRLEGELPATLPAALEANGKTAGELTSAAALPSAEGPSLLALGYVRRDALAAGSSLSYPGGVALPVPSS